MLHKLSGRKGAMLFKGFHKAPAGILINGCVLKELFSDNLAAFKTGGGNKFHIYLNALPWIIHFFIWFRDIFWIRRVYRHDALLFQEPVKAGDRAGIAALTKFDPEDDETGMRVSAAHIPDQADLVIGMLVGMVMRSARKLPKRFDRTIITPFPAVDILTVCLVLYSSFGNTEFFSVFN